MGIFGFIGEVASATIKTALVPLAVVDDVVSATLGGKVETTKKMIKSVGSDLEKSIDELTGEM